MGAEYTHGNDLALRLLGSDHVEERNAASTKDLAQLLAPVLLTAIFEFLLHLLAEFVEAKSGSVVLGVFDDYLGTAWVWTVEHSQNVYNRFA